MQDIRISLQNIEINFFKLSYPELTQNLRNTLANNQDWNIEWKNYPNIMEYFLYLPKKSENIVDNLILNNLLGSNSFCDAILSKSYLSITSFSTNLLNWLLLPCETDSYETQENKKKVLCESLKKIDLKLGFRDAFILLFNHGNIVEFQRNIIIEYLKEHKAILFNLLIELTSNSGFLINCSLFFQDIATKIFFAYFEDKKRLLPITGKLVQQVVKRLDKIKTSIDKKYKEGLLTHELARAFLADIALFYHLIEIVSNNTYCFFPSYTQWPFSEKYNTHNDILLFQEYIPYVNTDPNNALNVWPNSEYSKRAQGTLSFSLFQETLEHAPILFESRDKKITIGCPYVLNNLNPCSLEAEGLNSEFVLWLDFFSKIPQVKEITWYFPFFQLNEYYLTVLVAFLQLMPQLEKFSLTCYVDLSKPPIDYSILPEQVFSKNVRLQSIDIKLITSLRDLKGSLDIAGTTIANGENLAGIYPALWSYGHLQKRGRVENNSIKFSFNNNHSEKTLQPNVEENFNILISALFHTNYVIPQISHAYRTRICISQAYRTVIYWAAIDNKSTGLSFTTTANPLFIKTIKSFFSDTEDSLKLSKETEQLILTKPFLCSWTLSENDNAIESIINLVGNSIWKLFSEQFTFNDEYIYLQLPTFLIFLDRLKHEKENVELLRNEFLKKSDDYSCPLTNFHVATLSQAEYNLCIEYFERKGKHYLPSKNKIAHCSDEILIDLIKLFLHTILKDRYHLIREGVGILIDEMEQPYAEKIKEILKDLDPSIKTNLISILKSPHTAPDLPKSPMFLCNSEGINSEATANLNYNLATRMNVERVAATLQNNNCLFDVIFQSINELLISRSLKPLSFKEMEELTRDVRSNPDLGLQPNSQIHINIPKHTAKIFKAIQDNLVMMRKIYINFKLTIYYSDLSGEFAEVENNADINNNLHKFDIFNQSRYFPIVEIPLKIIQVNYIHFERLKEIKPVTKQTIEISNSNLVLTKLFKNFGIFDKQKSESTADNVEDDKMQM